MAQAILPLAVSLGDPAGVGPELIAAAWFARRVHALPAFCAVGGAGLLASAARARGLDVPVRRVESLDEAAQVYDSALPVLGDFDGEYRPGAPDREGAMLAFESLKQATALAVSGQAGALMTGPIAKSRLAEVGFNYPGQTEFVAAASGVEAEDAVMMLAGPNLRTVPLTVHVALSAVPGLITQDLILRRSRIVARALMQDFGLKSPRIAIAALNPHAGEDGRFGDEDQRVVAPAIEQLRAEGIDASGPHASDGMFAARSRAGFDVAICMYHDQALIPLKALDFDHGVNITLGLPFIRTSPDHGTAFPIAGKGQANVGATVSALRLAAECARSRAVKVPA